MTLTAVQQAKVEESLKLVSWSLSRSGMAGIIKRLGWDEAESVAHLALCRAALCYDEEKGKWITYANRCIYNALILAVKTEVASHDFAADLDREPASPEPSASLSLLDLFQSLPERTCGIMTSIYIDGDTQTEVAERLGLSRQRVEQIHAQACRKLGKQLEPPR